MVACSQKISSMSPRVNGDDHVAPMGFELNHALAAQRPQRLAYGCDADAEFGRRLVEPDERAGSQCART